jgi:hypothetical protein
MLDSTQLIAKAWQEWDNKPTPKAIQKVWHAFWDVGEKPDWNRFIYVKTAYERGLFSEFPKVQP